jgi:hypothetical protein
MAHRESHRWATTGYSEQGARSSGCVTGHNVSIGWIEDILADLSDEATPGGADLNGSEMLEIAQRLEQAPLRKDRRERSPHWARRMRSACRQPPQLLDQLGGADPIFPIIDQRRLV